MGTMEAALREAVEGTFAKYGETRGGRDVVMPMYAIIKHAAKAAGQKGIPGTKKQRRDAIEDYIKRAREGNQLVENSHGLYFVSPSVAPRQGARGGPSEGATAGSSLKAKRSNSSAGAAIAAGAGAKAEGRVAMAAGNAAVTQSATVKAGVEKLVAGKPNKAPPATAKPAAKKAAVTKPVLAKAHIEEPAGLKWGKEQAASEFEAAEALVQVAKGVAIQAERRDGPAAMGSPRKRAKHAGLTQHAEHAVDTTKRKETKGSTAKLGATSPPVQGRNTRSGAVVPAGATADTSAAASGRAFGKRQMAAAPATEGCEVAAPPKATRSTPTWNLVPQPTVKLPGRGLKRAPVVKSLEASGPRGAAVAAAVAVEVAQEPAESPRPSPVRRSKWMMINPALGDSGAITGAGAAVVAEEAGVEGEAQPKVGAKRKLPAKQAAVVGGGESVRVNAWREQLQRTDVKSGRFSEGEKQILRSAVAEYASDHGLSPTDLSWLFNTRKGEGTGSNAHSRQRGAWQTIAEALPQRNPSSVWSAGTRLLHPDHYKGKWTEEEDKALSKGVAELGERWSEVGGRVGRLGQACRDRWRETCLGEAKRKGVWSKEENQKLMELVEGYLQGKQDAGDDEKVDRRHVMDGVNWSFIARQHGSRSHLQCYDHWYHRLAPTMIEAGTWCQGDDRRLLKALLACGATEEHEVPWLSLMEMRTGALAKRRWHIMRKIVPDRVEKSFTETLDYLVDTHAPKLRKLPVKAAA